MKAIICTLLVMMLAASVQAHDTNTRHIHPKAEHDNKLPKMKPARTTTPAAANKKLTGKTSRTTATEEDHAEMLELQRQNSLSTGLEAD